MRFHALPILAAAALLLAAPALAGGEDCAKGAVQAGAKKCTASAEECQRMMAEARGRWLGIELDDSAGTLTITRVIPESPAAAAGFAEGDVLVAMNGVAFEETNHEKIYAMKKTLKTGDRVSYTVRRGGNERSLTATLGTMPDEVYNAWTREHLKEHAEIAAR